MTESNPQFGTIERLENVASLFLRNRRPIDIILPPDYHRDDQRTYPVLYLNDGQDVPSLGLRKSLSQLYRDGSIQPLIVVAIAATVNRMHEYGTAGILNAQGYGTRANAYQRFLLSELMPLIDRRYRTHKGPQQTAIAGFSLGGLSAFDSAWHHPHVFGTVGVFSGSFWWRTDDSNVTAKQSSRIVHRNVRLVPVPPQLRFWFQVGTDDEAEDRDGNGIIDAIQDTRELIAELVTRGYDETRDIHYLEVTGGQHNQQTWGMAFPDFLHWAFPAAS